MNKHELEQQRRSTMIEQLILAGVYKLGGIHLYELSDSEIETLFDRVMSRKNIEIRRKRAC